MEGPAGFFSDPRNLFSAVGSHLPQPSAFPTAREVSHDAKGRSSAIFAQWHTLHDILDRYEELIRRRWLKKTQSQRTTILLTAWPEMSKTHRPDFVALRKETQKARTHGSRYRDAFLWPYVNLEDLVQGKVLLLLLLNSRGRQLPECFAFADFEAAHLGIVSHAIQRPFLNQYTMLFAGQTVAENYGKLVAWDDDDRAFDWLMSGAAFSPGDGLVLLEIQQRLMEFLVKCCELILHDYSPSSLTEKAALIHQEPPPLSSDPTAWASLASLIAEAPYRVPSRLDLKRLKAIIAAKRSAAKDHIWSLREDPGYFADTVKDFGEHRQETILTANGKSHPLLQTSTIWNRTLGDVITDAYGGFIIWDDLHKQLTTLAALVQSNPQPASWDSTVAKKYSDQLHHFQYHLQQMTKGPILSLKKGVPASPQLRSLFVRESQEKNTTIIKVRTKNGIGKNDLLGMFSVLWDDEQLFLYGLSNVMDELDRILYKDAAQRQNVSSWVADKISNLSILAEGLRQLKLFQPWANGSENRAVDMDAALKAGFAESMSDLAKVVSGATNLSVAEEGNPSARVFYYPTEKLRSQQTVEDMRKAENRLDKFWNKVDQHFSNHAGGWDISRVLSEHRELYSTPAWTELPEESKVESESQQPEPSHWPARPFSLSTEHESRSTAPDLDTLPLRAKIKIRGVSHPQQAQIDSEQSEDIEPGLPQRIVVGKRAFKVFSTLFHLPSQSDQPGEIPWLDFVHAMSSTGFVPEKLGGSIWQFTPTKLDVERSISFHEPHPHRKIPFVVARRFGRRLNRAYRWTGDTFTHE